METKTVKIKRLNYLPGNSRIHDDEQIDFLMKRLEAGGTNKTLNSK